MLSREQIIGILEETGSLKAGHFILSSGLHSNKYVQCALVLSYPQEAKKLCLALAEKLEDIEADIVVGPAMGGVVVAYELAGALGLRGIFSERVDGKMQLRRGFEIEKGQKVLVVEDVVTTGKSAKEVITMLENIGAKVIGVASIIDRSGGSVDFGVPFNSLVQLEIPTFKPSVCPMCAEGAEAVKPGSRK